MSAGGRIDPDLIERVRTASDIVAVAGEYVRLTRAGRSYKGLCPFHHEKTPSFTVSPEKQVFYCFGCGAGGNVFHLVMRLEKLDFPEAVRRLAQRAGIPLPGSREKGEGGEKVRWLGLLEVAARFYRQCLQDEELGRCAREYLSGRGVSAEAREKFELGYAPPEWDRLLRFLVGKGYRPDEAEKVGLVAVRGKGSGYYDRFRDRIIFPIRDLQGRVVGFGGRALGEGAPKYLNSPETPLYHKGEHLFGLFQAREAIRSEGRAVLVEGYLDAVMAHQCGFNNVVASLGTALTEEQARLLGRLTEEIVLCYDADTAGAEATLRGLHLLQNAGPEVRVMVLPAGEDPDSFLRKEGPSGWNRALAGAVPLTRYLIDSLLARFDLSRGDELVRTKAVQAVAPVLAGLASPAERRIYLEQVAARVGLSPKGLEGELERWRTNNGNNLLLERNTRNNTQPALSKLEEDILYLLATQPSVARRLRQRGVLDGFSRTELCRVAQALAERTAEGRAGAHCLDELDPEAASLVARIMEEEEVRPRGEEAIEEVVAHFEARAVIRSLRRLQSEISAAEHGKDLARLHQVFLRYKALRDGRKPAAGG